MINPNNLCMGCMNELAEGESICSKCGFSPEDYNRKRSGRTLAPMTILAGKYLLGKVLGEGGFGITYLAWDLNKEEKIAVKEYFPGALAYRNTRSSVEEYITPLNSTADTYYQKGLKSFVEEARNLKKFDAIPGIVSVKDFFYENKTAYIVMEYIEGMTLKQVMEKLESPMVWSQVLEVMHPVLKALEKIHREGIIHRDISPDNIIVGGDGKVTLIDFGAARFQTGNETKSLSVILKQGYAPVEQYQSRGKQGPWTDVYAVCATMYYMMSGIVPAESIERISEELLVPLSELQPDIPREISDAVSHGMKVLWQERSQDMQVLEAELYEKRKSGAEDPYPKLEWIDVVICIYLVIVIVVAISVVLFLLS